MFHFLTFFTVSEAAEATFVRRLGTRSPWQAQVCRIAPALVGTDLMRHQSRPLYLCHDFWTTQDAYEQASENKAVRQLLKARKRMADDYFELGAFSFPALREESGTSKVALAPSECLPPVHWISTEALEDELLQAAVHATMHNRQTTAGALAQIDAYFANDDDGDEKQHRHALLRLLRPLRPNLAELLGGPRAQR